MLKFQLATSTTEDFNQMDNQDHVTIEVENRIFHVYHEPDLVPKQRNKGNAAKGTRSQRTCFYCRNPGHKIAYCPYYEPVDGAKSTETSMKNEVPHALVPFIEVQSEVPEKHQEQEARNDMDSTYPKSPSGVTSILERMNALEELMKKVSKEVTNLTKALQLTNTRDKHNQKRKNNSQACGQATFGKLKKLRNIAKAHSFHQLYNVHESSSGATLPPKVNPRIARTNESHIAFFRQKKKTTNSLSQDLTAVPSYMEKYTKHPVAIVLFSLLLLGCFAKQARCRAMDDLGDNKAFSTSAADPDCWRNRIGGSAGVVNLMRNVFVTRVTASKTPNATNENS
ncbi:hypothetical protein EJB05_24946, partial [Eragrostis curvula]